MSGDRRVQRPARPVTLDLGYADATTAVLGRTPAETDETRRVSSAAGPITVGSVATAFVAGGTAARLARTVHPDDAVFVTFSKRWTGIGYQVHTSFMVVLAVVLLGWCLLSLPVGLVVGRLLREPHPQAQPAFRAARPSTQRTLPQPSAVA